MCPIASLTFALLCLGQIAIKSRLQGASCAEGESNIFFVTPNTVDPAGGTRITVAGQCLGASAEVSAGGIECSTTVSLAIVPYPTLPYPALASVCQCVGMSNAVEWALSRATCAIVR
jgi:hypothetical protein